MGGNADPSMKFPNEAEGVRAVDLAISNTTLALLKALAGDSDFDVTSLDKATNKLKTNTQEIAERMIDSIAEAQASKRKIDDLNVRQQAEREELNKCQQEERKELNKCQPEDKEQRMLRIEEKVRWAVEIWEHALSSELSKQSRSSY